MDYEEFELYLRPDKKGFEVEVRNAPIGGGPRERSTAPCSEAELEDVLAKMEWRLCVEAAEACGYDGSHCTELAEAAGVEPDAWGEFPDYEALGERLFAALFPGEVGGHFKLCRSAVEANGGDPPKGLRLRLVLASSDPEHLGPLAAHPWELIWDRTRGVFLGHVPTLPLVRRIDAPLPKRDLLVDPPLRVLLVAPSPEDSGLDLAEEQRRLREALAERPDIEVEVLKKPTVTQLRRTLRNGEFHVVHFMGHGNFDDESGLGYLFFEDDEGDEHPVEARASRPSFKPFPISGWSSSTPAKEPRCPASEGSTRSRAWRRFSACAGCRRSSPCSSRSPTTARSPSARSSTAPWPRAVRWRRR